jgi:hypothetical protein
MDFQSVVLPQPTYDGLPVRRTAPSQRTMDFQSVVLPTIQRTTDFQSVVLPPANVRRTSSPSYFSGFFNLSIPFVVNRFVLACEHVTCRDVSDIKGLNYP